MDELHVTLDSEGNTDLEIETALRISLAHARVQSAENRTSNPVAGRSWSIVATHLEDALYRIWAPVP